MKTWIQTLLIPIVISQLTVSCKGTLIHREVSPTTSPSNGDTIPTLESAVLDTTIEELAIPQIDYSCWEIKPLEKAGNINESLFYISVDSTNPSTSMVDTFFTLNLESLKVSTINSNYRVHSYFQILESPDNKKFVDITGAKIIFIDQNGIQSYTLPDKNFFIKTYLKDGRVVLRNIQDTWGNNEKHKEYTYNYYIFDPSTSRTEKNTVSLPDYFTGESELVSFSFDLKYLLYKSNSINGRIDFTLYDVEKNKVVWVGPPRDENLGYVPNLVPDWAPNQNTLIAQFLDNNGHVNYYSISTDGKIESITKLNMFALMNGVWKIPTTSSVTMMMPKWSPDERYVVSAGKGNEGNSIYLWDNQQQVGYKPCLPNETKIVAPPSVKWTLDSNGILVNLAFDDTQNPLKSYILDPTNHIIYEVPEINDPGDGKNILLNWVNWEFP